MKTDTVLAFDLNVLYYFLQSKNVLLKSMTPLHKRALCIKLVPHDRFKKDPQMKMFVRKSNRISLWDFMMIVTKHRREQQDKTIQMIIHHRYAPERFPKCNLLILCAWTWLLVLHGQESAIRGWTNYESRHSWTSQEVRTAFDFQY